MAVVITPESELGIELAKWNKPYRYEEFPRMLYRAQRQMNGKWSAHEELPHPFMFQGTDPMAFQREEERVHAFNAGCQRIVKNEDELRKALNEGWRKSIAEANALHEAEADEVAAITANRHYHDQFMSEAARAEARAADEAAGAAHVPDVPRRGPGRPRKES